MRKISAVLAVGAALIATQASAAPGCLQLGRIWSWKAVDNKTLIVEDTIHQKFKLSLMGYCPNLQFRERVGFKAFGGTQLSCMSKGDYVLVRGPIDGRCPIIDIVPYTPEMEKADKASAAAKAAGQPSN